MSRIEAPQGPTRHYEQVESYIAENRIPLRWTQRTCADGRYKHGKRDGGRMASFGADVGKIIPLLDLGVSPTKAVDLVFNAVTSMRVGHTKKRGAFYLHTETGPDWRDLSSIGCGHIKTFLSSQGEDLSLKVSEVLYYLDQLKRGDNPIEVNPLKDKHREEALIINEGLFHTVRPNDGEQMFFVHDRQAERLFVEHVLFPSFKEQGLALERREEVEYLARLELQTQQTINRLAPNAPVYRIDADTTPPFVF